MFLVFQIDLVSRSSSVIIDWEDILDASGATVVSEVDYEKGTVDFVVSDQKPPAKEMKRLNELQVPVVASEFVIQCLIHQTQLPWYQHSKFWNW